MAARKALTATARARYVQGVEVTLPQFARALTRCPPLVGERQEVRSLSDAPPALRAQFGQQRSSFACGVDRQTDPINHPDTRKTQYAKSNGDGFVVSQRDVTRKSSCDQTIDGRSVAFRPVEKLGRNSETFSL